MESLILSDIDPSLAHPRQNNAEHSMSLDGMFFTTLTTFISTLTQQANKQTDKYTINFDFTGKLTLGAQ
jgi:hypothetical protein